MFDEIIGHCLQIPEHTDIQNFNMPSEIIIFKIYLITLGLISVVFVGNCLYLNSFIVKNTHVKKGITKMS